MKSLIERLPVYVAKHTVLGVVETPRLSRNKYRYDPELGILVLHSALPLGMTFPFDFGFIPATRASDGDPLDLVILASEEVLPGTAVPAIPIATLKLEEKGERNDRILAVWAKDPVYGEARKIKDLSGELVGQLCGFFEAYPRLQGRDVRFKGCGDAEAAFREIDAAAKAFAGK
jgi:inorganic pyrophosphatase